MNHLQRLLTGETTNLRMVTPPTAEPLTLEEVMGALNLALDDRHLDDWLRRKIRGAREAAEEILEFPLTDAIYEWRRAGFAGEMPLPLGNIGAITEIAYIDANGDTQTLDPAVYVFDDNPRGPRVLRAGGASWPVTASRPDAVSIRFQGSYSESTDPPNPPPEMIKHALEMLIGHWHENREAVIAESRGQTVEVPLGVRDLLRSQRVFIGV